jgi:hypothetical protein
LEERIIYMGVKMTMKSDVGLTLGISLWTFLTTDRFKDADDFHLFIHTLLTIQSATVK